MNFIMFISILILNQRRGIALISPADEIGDNSSLFDAYMLQLNALFQKVAITCSSCRKISSRGIEPIHPIDLRYEAIGCTSRYGQYGMAHQF